MKSHCCTAIAALILSLVGAEAMAQGSGGTSKLKWFRFTTEEVELPYVWGETYETEEAVEGYRGVDDFFTVREANANIQANQWEFELSMGWGSYQSGSGVDDAFTITPSLKYAYTERVNIEIGLEPINFGDGTGFGLDGTAGGGFALGGPGDVDNGNGDVFLKYFWQLHDEDGYMPAVATWWHVRFPSGDGSEDIDGTWNFNFTKTIGTRLRAHLAGYVRTANGSRGDLDQLGNRRDFQYGAGAGLDYGIDDQNVVLFNYQNRASEYDGNSSTNSYELGWVHHLSDAQQLMIATTYNDTEGGLEEGPEWNARVQWSIGW